MKPTSFEWRDPSTIPLRGLAKKRPINDTPIRGEGYDNGWTWERHMAGKNWVYSDDLANALAVARKRWSQKNLPHTPSHHRTAIGCGWWMPPLLAAPTGAPAGHLCGYKHTLDRERKQ